MFLLLFIRLILIASSCLTACPYAYCKPSFIRVFFFEYKKRDIQHTLELFLLFCFLHDARDYFGKENSKNNISNALASDILQTFNNFFSLLQQFRRIFGSFSHPLFRFVTLETSFRIHFRVIHFASYWEQYGRKIIIITIRAGNGYSFLRVPVRITGLNWWQWEFAFIFCFKVIVFMFKEWCWRGMFLGWKKGWQSKCPLTKLMS